MKKTLLALGTIATITTPIIAVVSCGEKTKTQNTRSTNDTTRVVPKQNKTVDQSAVSKKFLELLLADENNIVEPIHHDSTQDFMNKIIPLWTQAEKATGIKQLTFEEGFTFDQTSVSTIDAVAVKVTHVVKGLVSGLLNEDKATGTMKAIMPELKKLITVDLVKSFIQEKYISSGLLTLIKGLLDGVFQIDLVAAIGAEAQADLLWLFIKGLVPFKEDADHTNITATYNNNALIYQYKDKKTLASLLANIQLATSSLASPSTSAGASVSAGEEATNIAEQPKTKLALGSLMKILTDEATTNFVSGLLTYISRDIHMSAAIKALIKKMDDTMLHVHGTKSFNSSSILLSVAATGPQVGDLGRATLGLIDWYRTTRDSKEVLVDKNGAILAEISPIPGNTHFGVNIKFFVDKLPLKTTINGANVVYEGKGMITNSNDDFKNHTISLREIISEQQIKDAMHLIEVAYSMILTKMQSFGVREELMSGNTQTGFGWICENIINRLTTPNFKADMTVSDAEIQAAHAVGATDVENHLKAIRASIKTIYDAFPGGTATMATLTKLKEALSPQEQATIAGINIQHATPDQITTLRGLYTKGVGVIFTKDTTLQEALTTLLKSAHAVQIPTGLADIIALITGNNVADASTDTSQDSDSR